MKRIRGKNFTVAQFKRLQQLDVENLDEWLLKQIKYVNVDEEAKRLGKGEKDELWILIHKETGETQEIWMD